MSSFRVSANTTISEHSVYRVQDTVDHPLADANKFWCHSENHSILLLKKKLAATSDGTSTLGGDKTTLLTARSISSGSSGVTDVLMVTTTMGMLDGVHSDTSDSGPVSLLGVRSVVGAVSSEERLISSLATGNDADHSSAAAHHGFTDTGWKSNTGLSSVLGVTNNDSGGARGTGEATSVTKLSLNVRDNSALGHLVDGNDVADSKRSFGATVDELSSVHTLNSDEILSMLLEFIGVSEADLGERGTSAGVVHDVLDNTLDVASALGKVEGSESSWCNSLGCVRLEDGRSTTSLHYESRKHLS